MSLKLGIIGAQGIGKITAQSALLAKGVDLAAVADLDIKLAEKVSRELGVKQTYAAHTELLEDPEIDAVSVCVSTPLHARVSVDALNAGKHVMVEKPPALFAREVLEMGAAAAANERLLSFNYERRHDPLYRKARELIAAGKLGKVYHARAAWFSPTWKAKRAWLMRWETKGGTLNNLASHYLDIVWFLMGSPNPQWAMGAAHTEFCREYAPDHPGDDYFSGLVGCEGGQTILIEGANRMHRPYSEPGTWAEVYGTEGAFLYPNFCSMPEKGDLLQEGVEAEKDDRRFFRYVRQIENFAAAVSGSRSLDYPAAEAYRFQCMLDALYKSAECEERVQIKPPFHPVGQH